MRLTPKAGRLFEKLVESREAEYTARSPRGLTKAKTNALTTLLGRIADNMGGGERVDNDRGGSAEASASLARQERDRRALDRVLAGQERVWGN